MLYSSFTCMLAGAALATASVLPVHKFQPRAYDANSTLGAHEVIVYGDNGRAEVWHQDNYHQAFSNLDPTPKTQTRSTHSSIDEVKARSLKKTRSCNAPTVFEIFPESTFVDWDVPMSSAVHATGDTSTVTVTAGYTVANSLTVTSTVGVTDKLTEAVTVSASVAIAVGVTWTTSYQAAYAFAVPKGKYGVVVSNPLVTRNAGNEWDGCLGSQTPSYFQSDTHYDQTVGNGMSWVKGVIALCVGDVYPVPRCVGSGFLY